MSSSTRTPRNDVLDLCETIYDMVLCRPGACVLGMYLCVRLTLTQLRHNTSQELLAEVRKISQATASRVNAAPSDTPARVSDPHDGCTHDTEALHRCGLLDVPTTDLPEGEPPPLHIGDRGCTGQAMTTPRRKPANPPLHPDDKTYNTTSTRSATRSKEPPPTPRTWRVLHTSYKGLLDTFQATITATLGIIFTYTP